MENLEQKDETLEMFLQRQKEEKAKKNKKQVIKTENELVENVQRTLVLEDGRQLLM